MLVPVSPEAWAELIELMEFAEEHNLLIESPTTYTTPIERGRFGHFIPHYRNKQLFTWLNVLGTYGEHHETVSRRVQRVDGQTGQRTAHSSCVQVQKAWSRCLLGHDNAFMSMGFAIDYWDQACGRPPGRDEYYLGTHMGPREVGKYLERLSGVDLADDELRLIARDKDYWHKYGARYGELPRQTGIDHWQRSTVGGLIYGGPGYEKNGSGPQFTVSLDSDTSPGWSTHT